MPTPHSAAAAGGRLWRQPERPNSSGRHSSPQAEPTASASVQVAQGGSSWTGGWAGGVRNFRASLDGSKKALDSVDEEAPLPQTVVRHVSLGRSAGSHSSSSRPHGSSSRRGGAGGGAPPQAPPQQQGLSKRAKVWLAVASAVLVIAGGTAVAVGVTQATKSSGGGSSSTNGSAGTSMPPPAPAARPPAPPLPAISLPRGMPPPASRPPPPASSPSPPASSPPPPTHSPPPPPATSPPPPPEGFVVPPGAVPLWADDFAGGALDREVWDVQTGMPEGAEDAGQMQEYTASASNVRVEGGRLLLTARNDNGYTSGQVRSRAGYWPGMPLPGGGTARSVHVEARMTAPPGGPGLWAALWMQPVEQKYGGWPTSGEIDIVGLINGMVDATSGLHYGAQYPANTIEDVRVQQAGQAPYSDGPHTFELDWERDAITISVDGVPSRRFESRQLNPAGWFTTAPGASPQAPFDHPFRIILNLAIGGTWPGPPDASTPFPATLAVEHVRVWAVPDT